MRSPDTIRQVVFQVAFQPVFYPPRRQAREQLRKLLLDGGSLDCQICQEKVIPDVETPHGLPRARMVNGKNPSNLIRLPCHPNHVMCDKCVRGHFIRNRKRRCPFCRAYILVKHRNIPVGLREPLGLPMIHKMFQYFLKEDPAVLPLRVRIKLDESIALAVLSNRYTYDADAAAVTAPNLKEGIRMELEKTLTTVLLDFIKLMAGFRATAWRVKMYLEHACTHAAIADSVRALRSVPSAEVKAWVDYLVANRIHALLREYLRIAR